MNNELKKMVMAAVVP